MFGNDLRRDLQAELTKGYDVLHLEQLWCGWLALKRADTALVNVHHLVWIDLEAAKAEGMAAGSDAEADVSRRANA